MNLPPPQVIRTGNLAHDQHLVREAQVQAAAHGLAAHAQLLPQGGFQIAYSPMSNATHAGHVMNAPAACQACRRPAPTRYVTFYQNIGAIILRFPKTMRGHLCRRCIGKYFSEYTLTSLFLGWWGVISLFYTLATIPMNIVTYLGAKGLPEEHPGGGHALP